MIRRFLTAAAFIAAAALPLGASASQKTGSMSGTQSSGATAMPMGQSVRMSNVGGPLAMQLQGKPVVVRIHADWCPVCKAEQPAIDSLNQKYAGKISFVELDVTNGMRADAAAKRAKELGLTTFFNANKTATGTVAVIDPKTGNVAGEFYNDTKLADYERAISAVEMHEPGSVTSSSMKSASMKSGSDSMKQ